MKLSVVIPAYNSGKSIGTCIESVLAQPQKSKEVIVVDDGSTDSTAEIVKAFNSVKYLRNEQSGPATARNLGIRNSTGEIIAFIDSDCTAEKNWLAEMLKPFSSPNVAGVQGAYKCTQKEIIARFVQLEIEERYERMKHSKKLDWIGSYSAAYRREALEAVGFFDESFPKASGEDPELSFRMQHAGYRLVFNPNAIVFHSHPASLAKYLKTKFNHAFYRVKLYSKHREKMLQDSYTPQILKMQIGLFCLFAASLAAAPFLEQMLFLSSLLAAAMILSTLPFARFALRRDFAVALISPAIIFLRSAAFAGGLALGVLEKVVR